MTEKDRKQVAQNIAESIRNNVPDDKQKWSVKVIAQKERVKIPANIMVFQAFAYLAATKLKPATNCVLMLLFSKSAYENYVSMDVKTIAEILEYTEQSVVTALNELVKNNIVIRVKHPNDKRRNDYFLNPTAAWKGNSYVRKKVISRLQEDKKQLDLFNGNNETI